MCWNHVSDSVVKYGVFGKSLGSRIVFHYLNFKACLFGSLVGGDGNYHSRWSHIFYKNRFSAYPLQTLKLIFNFQNSFFKKVETFLFLFEPPPDKEKR